MRKYKSVAELLESPERWTQGTYAKNDDGNSVGVYSPRACSFCILGAIRLINTVEYQEQLAITRMENAAGTWNLPAWNDTSTHAEVLAAVRKAGI